MARASFPDLPIHAMREQLLAALLHVGRSIPPPGFVQFWSKWRRPVFAGQPTLAAIQRGSTESDAAERFGLSHLLRSTDGVRLGARLSLPEGGARPKGLVIATHGYVVGAHEPIEQGRRWLERGLGVLALRVRGFPGSTFDTGDWTAEPCGWIGRGIDDSARWSLPEAVGDVIAAFRALRGMFGEKVPISLHGESLGGALAILAASQLSGRGEVARMALGVPTMGDWNWRLTHAAGAGVEADVRSALHAHADRAREIRANLRLFDTVVHAKRVVCPVVMKIAARDPVVPPPTVGAIYNALGSAPGMKWRFLVERAHTDGLLPQELRRHAEFEQLAARFLDPDWSLDGMTAWEGRMEAGG